MVFLKIDYLLKYDFSPLHLAARNGLVEVTCKLLKTGASVLLVDSEGLTPALSCAPNLQVAQCLSLILKTYLQSNNKDCSGKLTLICHKYFLTICFKMES